MWLHMLLSSDFNDHRSFPFAQLRHHLGETIWMKYEKGFENAEALDVFAMRKVNQLAKYDCALDKMEEDKELVDNRKMSKEKFIANALKESNCLLILACN